MILTIEDVGGKKILAELIPDDEDPAAQLIAITETFGETQIILPLGQASRLGSALKMLARVATREDEARRKRMDRE